MSLTKNIKENDIVLCTVTRIDNAAVFVNLDEHNVEGTIILSEVSPGRIRNIREFVVVGKKIACKILRIKPNLELSLRRVSAKERDEIMETYKKERVLASILKPIVGQNVQKTISQIKEDFDTSTILDKLRDSPDLLKKYLTSSELEQLKKVLVEKKEKDKIVQQKITIRSERESGIQDIKSILDVDAEISYLGSSQFLIKVKGKEYKAANNHLNKILDQIKDRAKTHHVHLEVK